MDWVAVAHAALDQRGVLNPIAAVDLVLVPTVPADPMGLVGAYAELWLRLVNGPVADEYLTCAERELVREFADSGIASTDPEHYARVRRVGVPWMDSPFHELVYGLVCRLAGRRGIDVVFIKGPALERQGLRETKHSGDVDVWTDPARIMELAEELKLWGWKHLDEHWELSPLYHSVTMIPGVWGCEVDLHRHVPGFEASDGTVLDMLSSEGETFECAGVSVKAPRPGAHAVIAALHLMRPQQGRSIARRNEANAAKVLETAGPDALKFAWETGADAALHEVLTKAFPDEEIGSSREAPLNWRWRAEPDRLKRYVIMFRGTPLRSWPVMAYRSIWPGRVMALRIDRLYGGSTKSPLFARIRRAKRGIAQQIRPRGHKGNSEG